MRVFLLATVGVFALTHGLALAGVADPDLLKLMFFWGLVIALVTAARIGARTVARKSAAYVQNTVVVGAGDVGQLIARKLLQHPEYGINVVGLVDAQPKERRADLRDLTILGSLGRAPRHRQPLRGRSGHLRVLERLASPLRRADPIAPGHRRSSGCRSTTLRRDRPEARRPSGRRHAAHRPRARANPTLVAGDQAEHRHRRRGRRSDRRVAPVRHLRHLDQARLTRSGLLPADPPRQGHASDPSAEVPHDAGRRQTMLPTATTSPQR